jgi:UDP-galactopyranose mutase
VLIVGAGLSGATIGERCSQELNLKRLIVDKRDHLGGNCYDFITRCGIRASRYGTHLFHSSSERVWNYMQQFSEWVPFDHRVRGSVEDLNGDSKIVPIPPTQETVNLLFGTNICSEEDVSQWYASQLVPPKHGVPSDGEEAAL